MLRTSSAVSILAQPEGWAQHDLGAHTGRAASVSILAQPEGWAQHTAGYMIPPRGTGFNPRPARRLGAARDERRDPERAAALVSILAQPEGWAQRWQRLRGLAQHDVSILAQPEGWAQRHAVGPGVRATHRFNPRPARRLGAARKLRALYSSGDAFQSSPSPKAGRSVLYSALAGDPMTSFNPRPARRLGAAPASVRQRRPRLLRFNPRPARRLGAAMMPLDEAWEV